MTDFPFSLERHRSTLEGDSPFVWLFEVQVPTTPATRYRLTNHTTKVRFGLDSAGQPLEYDPFPIAIGDIDATKDGDLPEIQVVVSNITRELGSAVDLYDGLQGAPVVIRTVNLATLLDTSAEIRTDTVIRSSQVRAESVTFTLSAYNLLDERVPKFRFTRNNCPFLYGGARCGYPIPTSPTGVVGGGFATCPKTVEACTVRGEDEVARSLPEQHPERFGGWPGLPRLSQRAF